VVIAVVALSTLAAFFRGVVRELIALVAWVLGFVGAIAFTPALGAMLPDLPEYPAIRYYPPTGDLYFDIITRLGDAATFETVARELKEVSGVMVSVATPAALYRMKKNTVRAKDRQDATALRERFQLEDDQ